MFLFTILIGLAVYAGARFAHTQNTRVGAEQAALPAPDGKQPSPIAVLVELAKRGGSPPPQLIMCALAECEVLGRNDLALDIVKLFVAPVVYAANANAARNANPSTSPYATPPMPQLYAPPVAQAQAVMMPPAMQMPQMAPMSAPPFAMSPADRARMSRDQMMAYSQAPRADEPLPVPVPMQQQAAQVQQGQPMAPGPGPADKMPTDDDLIAEMMAQAGIGPTPPSPDTTPLVTAGEVNLAELDMGRRRPTVPPPLSWWESPIKAISDHQWGVFASMLQREEVGYVTPHHVGQYRQHRGRLAELGINADAIANNAFAQRTALEADVIDAYHHAHESGMLNENLQRLIRVPGSSSPHVVTLSGILGVVQCAGLEAAYSWFTTPSDRERFRYTTHIFERTNGAF